MKTKPTINGCKKHHTNAKFTPPHLLLIVYFAVLFLIFNSLSMTVQGQVSPNDPVSSQLTGYDNPIYWVGDPTENSSLQYLNLKAAWALTKGDPNVRVAIISNGNDWSQTDMPNPDNYLGYNFVDGNTNTSVNCNPYHPYHGTQMTSLICSKTNNGSGIFGVAGGWTQNGVTQPGVTPVFIKNASYDPATHSNVFPNSSLASLPNCLNHAIAKGAKVILIAENFDNPDPLEVAAFNSAVEAIYLDPCNQVTIITSAGDWNPNNSSTTSVKFPATNSRIISVAGVDSDHFIWNQPSSGGGSCFGPDVDFVTSYIAPGNLGKCFSTTNPYSTTYGTAVSAALLAGVVSLMYSVNPNLTHQDVFNILKESCYQTSNYNFVNDKNDIVGYGFPNAYTAIQLAKDYLGGIVIDDTRGWPSTNPYVPSNHTTGNIIIKSTGRLTLNAMNLGIATGKSIIIEPGGKLIVNNSIITNACLNKPWKGIQVWGDNAKNQYLNSQGNYWQGYLELNNSTVSNAEVAVDLWKPKDYTNTGGIVKATGSHFINNANAVHALRYKNMLNGLETNYIAKFYNCDFQITSSYFATNKTFYKHIDLDHVKGPSFSGCDFTLAPNVTNVSTWNQAIASYSAGFSLTSPCNNPVIVNCTNFDYSNISGFRWGINSNYDGSNLYTYTVNRAIFTNNVYGILNNVVKNQKVINSKFYIGNANAQYSTDCNFGIYMNSSNGFTIENNEFYKMTGAPLANYTGIFTANTMAIDDIYRNTFNGMSFGNLATKKNWSGNSRHLGLEYLCNNNTNNWADFFVYSTYSGIQSEQGGYTSAAGNTFSPTATWHFYNTEAEGNHLIGYYCNHNVPAQIPEHDPTTPGHMKVKYVTVHEIDFCNTCPDHFGNNVNVTALTTAEIDALATTHDNAKAQLQELDILYNQLTDGGSTPIKLTEIQAANETQMWSLRSTLLANSPYLSDTVLQQVASRNDIFPDAIIFEILAANPEALRNRNLMIYLAEKTNPLPDYMIGILELVAGQNSTYKTILQQQMSQYAHEATKAANKVIDSYLNDTILDASSLNTWLVKKGGIEADKQRIALMVANNDYTGAMVLAEDLPEIYSLNHEALDNYTAWFDLLSLQKTLHDNNRDWSQLTEAEHAYLETVAASFFPEAAAIAQGILGYNYNTGFEHCFDIDEPDALKRKAITPQDIAKAYGMTIEVNPNPAKEWAEFTYTLPVNEKSGEIKVTDMQGREVYSNTVSDGQGKKIWDTRTFRSGTYIYTFKSGKYSLSGKIVVSQ
jgi:hypothetical protein